MEEKPPIFHLNIGELIVSQNPAVISTILGSCVSVCLYSKDLAMGGIIHYALPNAPSTVKHEESFRYGDLAIVSLIEELELMTGQDPSHFVAKIIGGAVEIGSHLTSIQAGPQNIEIARSLLAHYRIPVIGEDVGGSSGRKILFHTFNGRLQVSQIKKNTPNKESHPKRKVLIVEDSKLFRDLLMGVLTEDPELEVVGMASNLSEATHLLARAKPDVVTLDIHMAKMSGIAWFEKLMVTSPIPVVMISSLQIEKRSEVLRAFELGAIDYIQKPSLTEISTFGPNIREKVKIASFAKVIHNNQKNSHKTFSGEINLRTVLAIGASTGGTEALKNVMCSLPKLIPPTLIVQHIPSSFSKAFADRLNELCPFEVKEAEDGDELKVSRVLIAPGGKQMKIQRTSDGLCVRITDDAPINRHKPSVDYLFQSIALNMGSKAVGVLLTGMGADGAKGLLQMRLKGARTIAQDEESSVVYGMPRIAFEMGAVEKVAPLSEIPRQILKALEKKKAA